MSGWWRRALRSFRRDESGAAAAQYVMMLPVVFGMFLVSFDGGVTTTRAALLDRALDMTARSIRLGTLANPTIAAIRGDMCGRLTVFPECSTRLKVQIIAVSRSDFLMPGALTCADRGVSLTPVRKQNPGQANPLVLLRACMTLDTLTPAELLSSPDDYEMRAATLLAATPG